MVFTTLRMCEAAYGFQQRRASKCCAGCQDDKAVVTWMVHTHKVSVIPGSGCGCPGYIRIAFGKPEPGAFQEAAARLNAALKQLCSEGFAVVKEWQQHGQD